MKCLLLTRYGRKGASSRLRSFQYVPYLESNGIAVSHHPLLDDDYVHRMYNDQTPDLFRLGRSVLDRIRFLYHARRFDLVWLEKELFPFLPPWAELWLADRDIPYVVDYDDPLFHRYDRHDSRWVRRFLGDKIDDVMRNASLVIAANDYLAERARLSGAQRVERLPTAIDLERYPVTRRGANGRFTIGWVGTPITQRFLSDVAPVLREIEDVHFVALGARNIDLPGVDVEERTWTEENEARDIGTFDVGIMPLPDSEWERGKSGYKLIQYMACGRPVVASPVGINNELVDDGENGYLASTADEWIEALKALKENAHLRKEMGVRGRKRVEERYCTRVTAPRLAELLRSAM